MSVVEVDQVTKRFDQFIAVNSMSFKVEPGSLFGLLGPNGAGKTTTIRMIVGITAPDEGEIRLLGEHVTPDLQQRIGYMPEERGLYKKMKVGEQLLFFAKLKGLGGAEAARRIDQWLARFELSDWKEKKSSDLSKGMQQKVQFISTILHDPELLILDEPFSGLDPVSVSVLKAVMLDLKAQGKAIIFSTHQMEQVEQLCDDICLINHSTKVLSGHLKEVKRRFGKNTVRLDYEGPDSFINSNLVKKVDRFPNYIELVLNDGADSQDILRQALGEGAKINKFELVEPSLNEIFIESVTGKNGKDPGNSSARVSAAS